MILKDPVVVNQTLVALGLLAPLQESMLHLVAKYCVLVLALTVALAFSVALAFAVALLAQAMVAVAAGLVSLVALAVSAWALPSAVAVLVPQTMVAVLAPQAMVAVAAGLVSLVADCFGDCFALVPSRQRQRPDSCHLGSCAPNRC